MKMATLAAYFGLGQQKHRSLADVRMNLEVLKHCATVLFLESSLPDVLGCPNQGSPTVATRSRSNGRLRSYAGETSRKSPPISSLGYHRVLPYERNTIVKMTDQQIEILCKAG
ncbi:hypothetical protein MKW94_004541 [Papaver nudicaule]|uniref:Exonuclease domain-containing protein n=1 Tax=Papaver nudicaule TaxID=74823 RepID=A0AA41S4V4_PAPNU|nr:hypothetical protein [Papaver nudicaule]